MSNHLTLCQVNQRKSTAGSVFWVSMTGFRAAQLCKAMDHALGAGAQLSSSGGKFISLLGLSFQLQLNPGFPEGQVGHPLEGLEPAWPILKPATPTGPPLLPEAYWHSLQRRAEKGKKQLELSGLLYSHIFDSNTAVPYSNPSSRTCQLCVLSKPQFCFQLKWG